MAVGTVEKLTTKGIRRELLTQIESYPAWWRDHCQKMDADTKVEPFGWAGAVPSPRPMVDGRRIRDIRAFTYNIENQEYELSVLFPRIWLEDDQTGAIRGRVADMAEAWNAYYLDLFTYMLEQGGTLTAYDGNTFFDDTRTEGDSGTIDNNSTSVAAADSAVPTAAEFKAVMSEIKARMMRFNDDQGRRANLTAISQLGVIIPPELEMEVLTALNATEIAATSNIKVQGLNRVDVNPIATVDATPTQTVYTHAMGSNRKGMVYQERTKLDVQIYDDPHWIDFNNGLLVTCRQRFVFAYGEFRRMNKHVFTT